MNLRTRFDCLGTYKVGNSQICSHVNIYKELNKVRVKAKKREQQIYLNKEIPQTPDKT